MEPYESTLPPTANEGYKTRYHNPTNILFRPSPTRTSQVTNQPFAPQFQNMQAHGYQPCYNFSYPPKTSSFKPETIQNLGGASNSSIETFTEEVTEEYESSGDVDGSLLGKIMRGEIDKKTDWPTPTNEAGVQESFNNPYSENLNYNTVNYSRGNTNYCQGENVTYNAVPDITDTMRNSSCNMENVTYSNKVNVNHNLSNRPYSVGGNVTYTINEEPNYNMESSLYTNNINYTVQDENNRSSVSAPYPSGGNISYNTSPDVGDIPSNTTNQYYERENPYCFKGQSEVYCRGEPTSNKYSTPSTPILHLQPCTADYHVSLPKKKFSKVSTTSEEITEEFYGSPEGDIDDMHLRKIRNDGGKKPVWSALPSHVATGKENNRPNMVYSIPKASLNQVQDTPHHIQVPFTATYNKPFYTSAYEIPREKSPTNTKNVKFNGNKATMFEVSSTPSGDTFQEEEITGLYNASDEGISNQINKITLSVIPLENEHPNQFDKHKRNSLFTPYSAGENIQNSRQGAYLSHTGDSEERNYSKFSLQEDSPGKTIRKVTKKTTKTIINPKANASKTYTKIQTSLINPTFTEGQEAGENANLKKMEAVEKSHLEQNLKKWQEARRRSILNPGVSDVNGANIRDSKIYLF